MKQPYAANYVVGFFDLLGQQRALEGQGLLPHFQTPEDERRFVAKLKETIGSIALLQARADQILAISLRSRRDSPLRAKLDTQRRRLWDEMHRSNVSTQRWSDGLMHFANLADKAIKCPMIGIYVLMGLAGALCFLGLSTSRPIRGAIEIAWGVELHGGELHGAAVARAYELESNVAKWPRVVVGPNALRFLQVQAVNEDRDPFSEYNKALAEVCLGMITKDTDGQTIIDYLAPRFSEEVHKGIHAEMYERALAFVRAQIAEHEAAKDAKLLERYRTLHGYYLGRRAVLD